MPQEIYDSVVTKLDEEREKKEDKQSTKVFKVFDKLFPKMPEDVRDEIYEHAWEQGSGRVGLSKDLNMETKVLWATEYWVLAMRGVKNVVIITLNKVVCLKNLSLK